MDANKVIDILLEKEAPQGKLLNVADFQRYADERKINVTGLGKEDFELWDRVGLLRPIIKVRSISSRHLVTGRSQHAVQYEPVPLKRRLRNGEEVITLYDHWYFNGYLLKKVRENKKKRIINPNSRRFRNWKNFKDSNGKLRVTYWYHPFQLLRLIEVLKPCELSVRFPKFVTFPLDSTLSNYYRGFKKIQKSLQISEAKFLKELALIVAIEDRYLPDIRGRFFESGGNEVWRRFREAFDARSVLVRVGMSISEVKKLRNDLAWKWYWKNEMGLWHFLVCRASYDARKELKGSAKLAMEYYEYAEMLGLYLKDLTEESQPTVEEIVHVDRYSSAFEKELPKRQMAALLRRFDIDLRHRVLFAVEGETEVEFVKAWFALKSVSLDEIGVKLYPLGGVNSLKSPQFKSELKWAKTNEALVFMIIDDEGDARAQVESLKLDGLIESVHEPTVLDNPDESLVGCYIWKNCFEDDNFSPEELAEAWIEVETRKSAPKKLKWTLSELLLRMNNQRASSNSWNAALRNAKLGNVTKPELGIELAKRCVSAEPKIVKLLKLIYAYAM